MQTGWGGGGVGTDSLGLGTHYVICHPPIMGFGIYQLPPPPPPIFAILENRSPIWEPVMQKLYLKHLILEGCLCFACVTKTAS